MVQVKKLAGVFPEDVVVLDRTLSFDKNGVADTEDEDVLHVLSQIEGYEVAGLVKDAGKAPEAEELTSEEGEEEEPMSSEEPPKAPAKPKRPASPKKPS